MSHPKTCGTTPGWGRRDLLDLYNRLPREGVESSSLELLRKHREVTLEDRV